MSARKLVASRFVALALAGALVTVASPVRAADNDFLADAGYGLLATVTNVFYMPAKILYAGFGGLVGGLAYLTAAGDIDTASGVWSPSVGGDYVLTGAMMRGDQPIYFVGPRHRRAPASGVVREEEVNWGREPMR